MELTEKQAQALDIVLKKYRNKEKRAVIAGYAGTGKSVTVKFIVDALAQEGIDPDKDVVYTSFTGKAVQRLVDLGNQPYINFCMKVYQDQTELFSEGLSK